MSRNTDTYREGRWIRRSLIALAMGFLTVFLVVPLVLIFAEAMRRGWGVYAKSLTDPCTVSAIGLTLLVVVIVVPLNTFFGVVAAWCVARFRFRGRQLLITLIDLPYSVSPVISGLIFILLFGRQGWLGDWLTQRNISIIFAFPGIVLATLFVTFPFVARELIPLMESQGNEEEEAAILLGASGIQTFLYVTLPNIRWGLLYGVLLCTGRALGEFGAVVVVSGSIRGETMTMPLQIETLYSEYQITAAFAVASLLTLMALVTLVTRVFFEWRQKRAILAGMTELPGLSDSPSGP
ncbi:MAG: sulfate ABC transporter permease subunit CysW, partial [Planctomycetia bacterium]|nr:sulfate ABC transporter permease subunit CysW [Planctomycetia bacterium]